MCRTRGNTCFNISCWSCNNVSTPYTSVKSRPSIWGWDTSADTATTETEWKINRPRCVSWKTGMPDWRATSSAIAIARQLSSNESNLYRYGCWWSQASGWPGIRAATACVRDKHPPIHRRGLKPVAQWIESRAANRTLASADWNSSKIGLSSGGLISTPSNPSAITRAKHRWGCSLLSPEGTCEPDIHQYNTGLMGELITSPTIAPGHHVFQSLIWFYFPVASKNRMSRSM